MHDDICVTSVRRLIEWVKHYMVSSSSGMISITYKGCEFLMKAFTHRLKQAIVGFEQGD